MGSPLIFPFFIVPHLGISSHRNVGAQAILSGANFLLGKRLLGFFSCCLSDKENSLRTFYFYVLVNKPGVPKKSIQMGNNMVYFGRIKKFLELWIIIFLLCTVYTCWLIFGWILFAMNNWILTCFKKLECLPYCGILKRPTFTKSPAIKHNMYIM